MLEIREWAIAIVTAVLVTVVVVLIGAALDIGILRSAGWIVGVAAGLGLAFWIKNRE